MSTRHPDILWAQCSEKIFLTVELPDAEDAQVKLEPNGKFTFTATSKDVKYETEIVLLKKVNVGASKINEGRRHTACIIQKDERGWWNRLLKNEGKPPPFVKADWHHWIDQDEEDEIDSEYFDKLGRTMDMNKFPELDHTPDSDDEEDDDVPDPVDPNKKKNEV